MDDTMIVVTNIHGTIARNIDTIINFESGSNKLALTSDGFVYNGETIQDAGEAYNAFMDFMTKSNNAINNYNKYIK